MDLRKVTASVLAAQMFACGVGIAGEARDSTNVRTITDVTQGVYVSTEGGPAIFKRFTPDQQSGLLNAVTANNGLLNIHLRPAWNPGSPLCTYNCGPVSASISASPSTLSLPANTAGNTNLTWTWDESQDTPPYEYFCVYVSVSGESDAHVLDCEHPGNTYTTSASWIVGGNYYDFRVSPGIPPTDGGPATRPVSGLSVFDSVRVTATVSGGGGGGTGCGQYACPPE
jgi:hypothetical protein